MEQERINGMGVLDLIHNIESHKKMHCRLTLNTLERELKTQQLPPPIKKAVLDGYNDLVRDVYAILGVEPE